MALFRLSPSRLSCVLTTAITTAVIALSTLSPAQADPAGSRPAADSVLQRAEAVRSGHATDGVDATLAMRDLAYALPGLSGAERERAERLLARPTDPDDPFSYGGLTPSNRCFTGFCLTWVSVGNDAPSQVDSNGDGVPDWVDTTRDTVDRVLTTFERMGYRAPLLDAGPPKEGSTTALDIYLANLGDKGLYGYCVPDVDNFDSVTPGYCVLDNDFSADEFGGTPLLTLGVTAAHELFHATQFAYDATESAWFMESTATWMEDEFVDDSNDNYQYLTSGPMGVPAMSLDDPDKQGFHVYGAWVLWRFLAEQLPSGNGPALVRKIWEQAGDGPGEPNLDGVRATRAYVEAQGQDWGSVLSFFAAANRVPASFYEEGTFYPTAPDAGTLTLTKNKRKGERRIEVDHLASKTILVKPALSIRGKWVLKLAFNLPDRSTATRAIVTLENRRGGGKLIRVPINATGAGSISTNFSHGDVSGVAVTLVNAGTRYECGIGTDWNCGGNSLDDDRTLSFTATAVKKK